MSYLEQARQIEKELKDKGKSSITGDSTFHSVPAENPINKALIARMSLSDFEKQEAAIEVCVPWHRETLWFVPTEADASALCDTGISRGRIFTVRELSDLFSIPGLTQEEAQTVTQVKMEFNGTVADVRPPRSGGSQ
jgi:hypothetical protein